MGGFIVIIHVIAAQDLGQAPAGINSGRGQDHIIESSAFSDLAVEERPQRRIEPGGSPLVAAVNEEVLAVGQFIEHAVTVIVALAAGHVLHVIDAHRLVGHGRGVDLDRPEVIGFAGVADVSGGVDGDGVDVPGAVVQVEFFGLNSGGDPVGAVILGGNGIGVLIHHEVVAHSPATVGVVHVDDVGPGNGESSILGPGSELCVGGAAQLVGHVGSEAVAADTEPLLGAPVPPGRFRLDMEVVSPFS